MRSCQVSKQPRARQSLRIGQRPSPVQWVPCSSQYKPCLHHSECIHLGATLVQEIRHPL